MPQKRQENTGRFYGVGSKRCCVNKA